MGFVSHRIGRKIMGEKKQQLTENQTLDPVKADVRVLQQLERVVDELEGKRRQIVLRLLKVLDLANDPAYERLQAKLTQHSEDTSCRQKK